jgi:hypothetical protein
VAVGGTAVAVAVRAGVGGEVGVGVAAGWQLAAPMSSALIASNTIGWRGFTN